VPTPGPVDAVGFRCGEAPVVDDPSAELVVCTVPDPGGVPELVRLGPAQLTASEIAAAEATQDPAGGWSVLLSFTAQGTQAWAELTGQAACNEVSAPTRRIALVVDGELVASPVVSPDVQCGVGIQGGAAALVPDGGGEQRARELAARLVPAG
jgi:SecD/SecF fusion protein